MLSQKQKLHFTSVSAISLQIVTIVCGFILPKFLLQYYGSAVNGLISSITQFLGFITLAECGIGAVVQSALYKPLSCNDYLGVSRIIVSAEHFYRNIAKILFVYTIILFAIYPFIIIEKFDYFYTSSLILIISFSSFAQYYFGITYKVLLASDQFGFVPILIQISALLMNLVMSVILIVNGCTIHIVKFVSSLIFVIQPLTVSFIAQRWYQIDKKVKIGKDTIPQKWNGIAQHVASVVLQSSGITVLTLFSTLENVSIYSIYFLVVNGVRSITMSITNGVQAYLGNLFAKGDMPAFKSNFESFEWKLHLVVSLVFTSTAVLIVPFVGVYTHGITDANYIVPVFGIMLTAAWGMYCIRLPYNIVVLAVGHYKQTQVSAIIEAVLNLVTAVALVLKFGLVGVAVGSLVAMIYRTCYLAWYISWNVINRSLWAFVKHLCFDAVSIALFVGMVYYVLGPIQELKASSYLEWGFLAIKTTVLGVLTIGAVNLLFYFKNFSRLVKKR